jgi:hypothetical protein
MWNRESAAFDPWCSERECVCVCVLGDCVCVCVCVCVRCCFTSVRAFILVTVNITPSVLGLHVHSDNGTYEVLHPMSAWGFVEL